MQINPQITSVDPVDAVEELDQSLERDSEVHVKISGKHFVIPCKQEEVAIIEEAASLLEVTLDKISHPSALNSALMAAMNISIEYVNFKREAIEFTEEVEADLTSIRKTLE